MNLLLKHCKKIILTSLVFALLFIANISLISAFKDINRGVVAAEFSNSDSITISNGSFTSTDSSNGYPYKANNLTYSENISTSHVTHGVINLNENTYSNNYKSYDLGKDDNPEKFDDSIDSYCLMINSLKGKNSCGYTTSSFNLDKNGHFVRLKRDMPEFYAKVSEELR